MPKLCLDCGHDRHTFTNGTYICDKCGKGKPKSKPEWAKSGRRHLPPGTTKLEIRRALVASHAGEPLSYPCKVKKCHQCNGKYRVMKPAGIYKPCMCTCHDAKNDRWVEPVNDTPGTRTCTKCKQSKPLSAYSKTGKRLKAWCRPCCVEINKAYRRRKQQEGAK